jgi:hypothetical protein
MTFLYFGIISVGFHEIDFFTFGIMLVNFFTFGITSENFIYYYSPESSWLDLREMKF